MNAGDTSRKPLPAAREDSGPLAEGLDALQAGIHHRFDRVKLLQTALRHSSAANERPGEGESNERLEFLGDAALQLAVSSALYEQFSEASEGQLSRLRSRLVQEKTLARAARRLGVDRAVALGRGEEAQGGRTRDALLADALEAMLGAVFLDAGFKAAKASALAILAPDWPSAVEAERPKDYKSRLQELTQERYKARPTYSLAGTSGPEHDLRFTARAELEGVFSLTAEGTSLRKAEQTAARLALELLESDRGWRE